MSVKSPVSSGSVRNPDKKPKASQSERRSGRRGEGRSELKIASVLAVDIVEHSTRSTVEQAKASEFLAEIARGCPTFVQATAQGSVVVGPAGDGFVLAFMGDPLAPVRCARELLKRLLRSGRVRVRMGIHIGAVNYVATDISGEINIAGEGVNMAVRALEGCAPNEIVITQRAADFVREAPEFEKLLLPLSDQKVKHGVQLTLLRLLDSPRIDDPLDRFMDRASTVHDAALARRKFKPAPSRIIAQRMRYLQSQTWLGLALIPIGLGLHFIVEHTQVAKQLQLSGYEALRSTLGKPDARMPVTFIDIADRFNRRGSDETDLSALRRLIDDIASHGPVGIAVDIDFGWHGDLVGADGTQGRYLDENEIVLQRALELTNSGIPVILGVHEGLAFQDPDDWLGARYQGLVAHPLRPDDALYGQIVMVGDTVVGRNRVPSLSGRLAEAFQAAHRLRRPQDPWFLTRYTEFGRGLLPARHSNSDSEVESADSARIDGALFLLNLSDLERIKSQHLEAHPAEPSLIGSEVDRKIRGKAVLIGATRVPNDFFTVPSTGQREWGPYFHALAAHTEIAAPLYEFTLPARMILLAWVGLFVLGVSQIEPRRNLARADQTASHWSSRFAVVAAVTFVYFGGIWISMSYGILWTEFILVALLTAMHPLVHSFAVRVLERLAVRNFP